MSSALSAPPVTVIKVSGFEDGMSNLNVEWPGARQRTKKEYFTIPLVTLELKGGQEEETVTSLASVFGNSELRLQQWQARKWSFWHVRGAWDVVSSETVVNDKN